MIFLFIKTDFITGKIFKIFINFFQLTNKFFKFNLIKIIF
jgi:hypothetical protein